MYAIKYSYQGVMPDGSVVTWLSDVPGPEALLAGPPGVTDVLQTNHPPDFGLIGPTGPEGPTGPTGPSGEHTSTGYAFASAAPGAFLTWGLAGSGIDLVGNLAVLNVAGADTTLQLLRTLAYGVYAGAIAEAKINLADGADVTVVSGSSTTITTIVVSGLYRFAFNGENWVLWMP